MAVLLRWNRELPRGTDGTLPCGTGFQTGVRQAQEALWDDSDPVFLSRVLARRDTASSGK